MLKRFFILCFAFLVVTSFIGIIIWVGSTDYLYKKLTHYNLGLQYFNSGLYEKAEIELKAALENNASGGEMLDDNIQNMLNEIEERITKGFFIGEILGDNWLGDSSKIVFSKDFSAGHGKLQVLRLKINVMEPGGFLPCNIAVFYKNELYLERQIIIAGEQNLDIRLPDEIYAGDTFIIMSDTFIPKNLGINDDERKLSVMLLDSQIIPVDTAEYYSQMFEVTGITPDGWISKQLEISIKDNIYTDFSLILQVNAHEVKGFYPCHYIINYPDGNQENY